jgi:hypothetical protein
MIQINLTNKKVLTISDCHIQSVGSVILSYNPSMEQELYNIFSYPQCHWGEDRVAIVKRDFNLIVSGTLPQYFISLWLTSEPKSEERDGSYLIVSFFADMRADQSLKEVIEDNLSDLDEIYPYFSVDYDV